MPTSSTSPSRRGFPCDLLPADEGLIVADRYAASVIRPARATRRGARAGAARCCCASPAPRPRGCRVLPIPMPEPSPA